MDLRAYSEERIGKVWTDADHLRLVTHMNGIYRLAKEIHELATEAQRAPLETRPEGARRGNRSDWFHGL